MDLEKKLHNIGKNWRKNNNKNNGHEINHYLIFYGNEEV